MFSVPFLMGSQMPAELLDGVGRDESPAGSWCEAGTEGWQVRLAVIMLCAL